MSVKPSLGITDIKVAPNVFSSFSASLKYEFQFLSTLNID